MKIKLADGETVELSAAQVKTLRAAARGNLRFRPSRYWAAPSERTRDMFEIDGQKGKATIPASALYREPLDLIDLRSSAEPCTATVTERGWAALARLNEDKWTVHSFGPTDEELFGRLRAEQDWGVLVTEDDARKLADWMAAQWGSQTGWTYTTRRIPVGTEPKVPHEMWLRKAGVR